MSKLKLEARMTLQGLTRRGVAKREIARLLGVTEGAVRYQVRRMESGLADGRGGQRQRAESVSEAIAHWREHNAGLALNMAALHEWLVVEHDYRGSLRSVQRYWRRVFPAPGLRARRRVPQRKRCGYLSEGAGVISAKAQGQPQRKRSGA